MAFLLGLLGLNALLGVIARRSIARRTDFHEDPVSVVSDIDAFTGNLEAPSQSMVQNTHKREQQTNKFISATWNNRFFIICPFLGTLVNQRVLPLSSSYSRNTLQEVTIKSGLPVSVAEQHVEGNFKYTVFKGNTQFQDIFNMEGATNEHQSSIGINDCQTTGMTQACIRVGQTVVCAGNTIVNKNCGIPSLSKFSEIYRLLDANRDGFIEESEIDPNVINGHMRSGRMNPRDTNFFGEEPNYISFNNLVGVFVGRTFPAGFRFPGGYGLREQHSRPNPSFVEFEHDHLSHILGCDRAQRSGTRRDSAAKQTVLLCYRPVSPR